ncbi:MAG TPA: ABC transporter permease [Candidatus Acidoferrum sp.]|nr:ABC transporter permease [Candidatus Acidoferrum sp.]
MLRNRLRSWLQAALRRSRMEREMDAELRFHIDAYAEDLIRSGMPRAEALRRARVEFGGVESAKEECREARGVHFIETVVQDLRYGFRALRKSPGFAAVAILTLALGIGANTAIFSVVNSALLRPLAYSDPQQLYLVREIVPQIARFYPWLEANLPDFRIWRQQVHSFSDVAIAEETSVDLTGSGEPEVIHGVRASANIFAVLGARPALGREFFPEEDDAGRGHVVILTDGFWRRRFHADPFAVGKVLTLDGVPHEIVGVLPATFRFPPALGGVSSAHSQDFFQPLNGPKFYEQDLIGEFDFAAVARLRPGVTSEQALAELNLVQAQIAKQANTGADLRAALLPLETEVVGPGRRGLIFLLAAVGAVLLIVCANLASLLLARVPGRMREAAIRAALGASRARILRQMLTETFLLSISGGALGIWIAGLAVEWLVRMVPANIPRLDEVQMDARVLLFALAIAIITGALFGILPAWRITRVQPLDVLKSAAAATSESRRTRRLRESLVGLEVGLTAALLILAGLLTGSLARLLRVNTGVAVDNVLIAAVDLPPQSYAEASARLRFYDGVLDGLKALPGVRAAGWISIPPLDGQGSVTGINVPGATEANAETPVANYRPVSPDYFSAMGIPLLHGRVFSAADAGRKVVVVSQSVADRFWPGKNPIGQICTTQWAGDVPSEVVGVVGDVRTVRLDETPLMIVYVPFWFNEISVPASASFVLRTSTEPRGSAAAARAVIHKTDPDVPVTAVRPMSEVVSQSVDARRFQMALAMLFAFSSLLLASLGIFGVVGYSVEQRRRELGIRVALGADLHRILRMVLRQGMMPVVLGLAGGMVAAIVAGRLIASLLFGVTPYDPLTLVGVSVVLGSVALLACYLPARRAMRVDPLVALRHE